MGYITERSRASVDVSGLIGKLLRFKCIPLSGVILSSGRKFAEISRAPGDVQWGLAGMQRSSQSGTFPTDEVDAKHTRPQTSRSFCFWTPPCSGSGITKPKRHCVLLCCAKHVHFTFPAKNGLLLVFSVVLSGNHSPCLTVTRQTWVLSTRTY